MSKIDSERQGYPHFGEKVGDFISSGNPTIDRVRREITRSPTTPQNFGFRRSMAHMWARLLMCFGIDVSPALSLLGRGRLKVEDINPEDVDKHFRGVKRCLSKLDALQEDLLSKMPRSIRGSSDSTVSAGTGTRTWNLHRGDTHNSGKTDESGPTLGRLAWKYAMGQTWYSRPAVADGLVYAASPGRSTIAYCLDEETGDVVWTSYQDALANRHFTARISSSIEIAGDYLLVRETGSWGNSAPQQAVNVLYLDRDSGLVTKRVNAKHIDYRSGYAPMAANQKYLVYPYGAHEILTDPPVVTPLNLIACRRTDNDEKLLDLHVGDVYCDPVLDENHAYVLTADGTVLCLNCEGGRFVEWQRTVGGAIYARLTVEADFLYFGANDGKVYSLNKHDGTQRWCWETSVKEPRAAAMFSTPTICGQLVLIGAANRYLCCLDKNNGSLLWEYECSDWIRSRPICRDGVAFVATMDGKLLALRFDRSGCTTLWDTKITSCAILADPVFGSSQILVATSNLYLYAISERGGKILWRHSLLECTYLPNGKRILADGGSGGNHQSTPIVNDDKVFIGGSDRFVYAVDFDTGRFLWRFETDGQVSAAPVYNSGRIFFGQQGGSENFYCLEAETGLPQWRQTVGWVWASANITDGRIVACGVDGMIHCLEERTGAILWRYRTGGGSYPVPSIDGKLAYVGSWDGWYYALDLYSGKLIWKYYLAGRPDSGASLVNGGRIFFQGHGYVMEQHVPGDVFPKESGGLVCLDGRSGETKWKQGPSNASLAIDTKKERLFGTLSGHLCCIDANNGSVLWKRKPGGGVSGPTLAGDLLYTASSNSSFFDCLDVSGEEPKLLWRYVLNDIVGEPCPAVAGGRVFILAMDGCLYAFD